MVEWNPLTGLLGNLNLGDSSDLIGTIWEGFNQALLNATVYVIEEVSKAVYKTLKEFLITHIFYTLIAILVILILHKFLVSYKAHINANTMINELKENPEQALMLAATGGTGAIPLMLSKKLNMTPLTKG